MKWNKFQIHKKTASSKKTIFDDKPVFYFYTDLVKQLERRLKRIKDLIKPHENRLKKMKELRNSFRPQWKRKKYGHNPQLIKRDEEIVIDYNILRQEGVIPGECLRSLALEYELSPPTIDDIVKGKTKRKKKLG